MVGATIRPAAASDVERLRAIEVDAGARFRAIGLDRIADDDPPSADELLAYVETTRAWVAVHEDLVVGYATASVVDGEGHLDQVSVAEDASGAGAGRALVERVAGWAAGAGFDALTLTTFADVAWNGPWYRRLGFVDVAADDLGPELAAIRAEEIAAGLDVAPRVAMRRRLS